MGSGRPNPKGCVGYGGGISRFLLQIHITIIRRKSYLTNKLIDSSSGHAQSVRVIEKAERQRLVVRNFKGRRSRPQAKADGSCSCSLAAVTQTAQNLKRPLCKQAAPAPFRLDPVSIEFFCFPVYETDNDVHRSTKGGRAPRNKDAVRCYVIECKHASVLTAYRRSDLNQRILAPTLQDFSLPFGSRARSSQLHPTLI